MLFNACEGANFGVLQVKKVKPHVLLGLSGVGGVFNEHVCTVLLWIVLSLVLLFRFLEVHILRVVYAGA